jgi:Protein of unknown function (DUF4238)
MNNPKKHHFTPEVYLKEFANSQKQFFYIKKGFTKITPKTVGQVCYIPNYFKLHSQDNLTLYSITDLNHIEKNLFKKHENKYPKLLKKFTLPSLSQLNISKIDILLMLEILVTIKKRNPTYRNMMISNWKNYVTSKQFREDVKEGIEMSKSIDTIDPEIYLENYINEAKYNEDKQADIYLRTFLENENKTINEAINIFMNHKIIMYHAPFGSQFITSDNPGFCVLPNDVIENFGGLGLNFKFLFPLTPKCCLYINHNDKDPENKYLLTKSITITHIDKQTVDLINTCTFKMASEKIFSYSSDTLKQFQNSN